jgi:hypothetical protein
MAVIGTSRIALPGSQFKNSLKLVRDAFTKCGVLVTRKITVPHPPSPLEFQ